MPDAKRYQPVFAVLAGKFVEPPDEGFGADYKAAFLATQLVRVAHRENCTSEDFVFDSPISLSQKITFDLFHLDDEGLYGSADAKRALAYQRQFFKNYSERGQEYVDALKNVIWVNMLLLRATGVIPLARENKGKFAL